METIMRLYELGGDDVLELRARELEANPDYKVLRRLPRRDELWLAPTPGNGATKIGVLDTEATGLVVGKDKMIELALVKMTLDQNGNVADLTEPLTILEDPNVQLRR
jgi:DNA polymerase III epsilon subunit-like protein